KGKLQPSRLTKKRNYRKKPGLQRLPDLFPLPLHEEEEVSSAETGLFGLISSVFGFLFGPLFSHVNLPPVGYKK
ncbi:hypothetical protein, partial [Parasutterella excrementihominis]|uniref:hypothetical protein n=1 Tax=Parasutterella excrementihominis TaxID=487175 RepID=UPI003AB6A148